MPVGTTQSENSQQWILDYLSMVLRRVADSATFCWYRPHAMAAAHSSKSSFKRSVPKVMRKIRR